MKRSEKQSLESLASVPGRPVWSESGVLKLLSVVSLFYAAVQVLGITGSLLHINISSPPALIIIIIAILAALIYRRRFRDRPAEIAVAGYELFPGVDISTQFRPPYREGTKNWSQAARVAANWISCLRFGDLRNFVYDSRWGGLGFSWLLSIPAVIWLLLLRWRRRRDIPPSGAVYLPDLVFVCLVMFFAMPRNHNHMARYTIWLAGLGLPCLAAMVTRGAISEKSGPLRRVFGYAWFGGVCLLAAYEAVISLDMHASLIERFRGEGDNLPIFRSVLRAARSPYPAGYRWPDFNGSIFEMIMAGDETTAVAIREKNQRHLIFGHLVQGKAFGKRKIVFIDHDRAEKEPGYLSRLLEENAVRYVIWDSRLPLYRELVNKSVRQDYELGKKLWNVFTFDPAKTVSPRGFFDSPRHYWLEDTALPAFSPAAPGSRVW